MQKKSHRETVYKMKSLQKGGYTICDEKVNCSKLNEFGILKGSSCYSLNIFVEKNVKIVFGLTRLEPFCW